MFCFLAITFTRSRQRCLNMSPLPSFNAIVQTCVIVFLDFYLIPVKIALNTPLEHETEPVHEVSNNVVYATSKASDQPAHTRSLLKLHSL